MKGSRRYYLIKPIKINGMRFNEVVIDSHVDKHRDHTSDELVVNLVRLLDRSSYFPAEINTPYAYFVSFILYENKTYRLVWLLEDSKSYIGVLTAFKDKGAKNGLS